jgi:hypothetical protein
MDVTDEEQLSPLNLAVLAGQQEVVALLLIRGAKITSVAIDGTSVIHQVSLFLF